jgi:hypothetical protein
MADAVGGDILEITFNHPTLGTGTWFGKAAEDSEFDLGGFRTNDDENQVDGGGRMIHQMNQVRWSADLVISWDANVSNELDQATNLAGDPVSADWTISHSNGTVWGGKGKPVGDIKANGNEATIELKLSGGGKLRKIVG